MTAIVDRIRTVRLRDRIRTALSSLSSRALFVAAATLQGPVGAGDMEVSAMLPYKVVADGIPEALSPAGGDAMRGKALVEARDPANCVLCHAVPNATIRFAGDVGPSLAGVGARLDAAQLRLRLVDNLRANPQTIMPSYYKVEGLARVAPAYRGKPILNAQQVEDVVAYLGTLR